MKKAHKRILATGALLTVATMTSTQSIALEKGEWIVKVGSILVVPDEHSGNVSIGDSAISGSGVAVDNNVQPGLTVTYMLSDKVGLELIAATPFSHKITGTGALAGLDVGETKHLPPTLSLQYFFLDRSSKFQPYAGIGFNYTAFFDEDLDAAFESAVGPGTLRIANSSGLSLQIGANLQINEKWLVNFGVWNVDIDTTATVNLDAGPKVEVDVDIDPWVYMLSVGYKF
jgi:outer membrane protein